MPAAAGMWELLCWVWKKIQDLLLLLLLRMTMGMVTNSNYMEDEEEAKKKAAEDNTNEDEEKKKAAEDDTNEQKKFLVLYHAGNELAGMGEEAEQEAKMEEQREALLRDHSLLSSEIRDPDYSSSSLTDDEIADRLREEVMEDIEKEEVMEEVWVDAPCTWAQGQEMEWQRMLNRMTLIHKKIVNLYMAANELGGMSEAEREAKKAKLDEREAALREYWLLSSQITDPDYSGMTEAERAEEAERLRLEAMKEARRLKLEGDLIGGWDKEHEASIIDFDPKQDGMYHNRMFPVDYTFDHDEESPFGPMRFTDAVYKTKRFRLSEAINVFSVRIACSDVGFPIQVYGTVIARDSIDYKCVYLFRRDRDHCQLISSKDEALILTGPKRGLALLDDNYVETDLKIKDHEGKDREFSKGILTINGIAGRSLKDCAVERGSIATRLSTLNVIYGFVKKAVEATVAVKVIQGEFSGTITAHTTSIKKRLVLYESKMAGDTSGKRGVIQLMRPVICVYVKDMLIIDAKTDSGKSVSIEFTPRGYRGKKVISTLGTTKLGTKVSWSIMDP